MRFVPLLFLAVSLLAIPAQAETNCAGITNAKARLACYDSANKPKEKKKTAPVESEEAKRARLVASWSHQMCSNYAAKIDRAMLEVGLSPRIHANERTLVVFMYLSKATVFKMITEAKVLDQAKDAECTKVHFLDMGSEGSWYFDLTDPGSCSRGLCWGM